MGDAGVGVVGGLVVVVVVRVSSSVRGALVSSGVGTLESSLVVMLVEGRGGWFECVSMRAGGRLKWKGKTYGIVVFVVA